MPAPSLNLIYKLEGDFEDGIDVFALAPVLLSVGQLIQESNKTLNPAGDEISVNVKPFGQGSFVVDISLVPANVLEQVVRALIHTDLSNIKTLLECIGLIGGGTVTGVVTLYHLMKFLRGQPKETKPLPDGSVSYTAQHGAQIIVNGPVHNLFQNPTITDAAARSIAAPLENAKVSDVKTYLKDDRQATEVMFDREDAESLKATAERRTIIPVGPQDDTSSTTTPYLHPKKADLEGEVASWSFRKAGSNQVVWAKMKDAGFLERIKSGDVRLSSADLLKVELVEKQEFRDGAFHLSNEVVRVLVYAPAVQQIPMNLEDNPPHPRLTNRRRVRDAKDIPTENEVEIDEE